MVVSCSSKDNVEKNNDINNSQVQQDNSSLEEGYSSQNEAETIEEVQIKK